MSSKHKQGQDLINTAIIGDAATCKLLLEQGVDAKAENSNALRWAALAKTLARQEQNRRASKKLKRPQTTLEI